MRVLVVDDDVELLDAYELLLTLEGHEVVRARNGAEAVHLVREVSPDVVLTDIEMPRVDGLTLLELLSQPPGAAPPVVANSGSGAFREQALARGASGFLEKPIDPQTLFSSLEEAVRAP